jgi:predicted extracellular nuclease
MTGLVVLMATTVPAAAQTTVFFNEIHYDNAGTDVGEAIEIAGPAGTDLSGWTIARYNGNGGALYGSDPLPTGPIPDLSNGFGMVVLDFPTNGLQNGSPDGIALIDNLGNVVQFLSYEGSFTAADGPAAGLVSTDIGVAESSSTAIGYSLQLAGTGTIAEQFTWMAPAAHTFTVVNINQTFSSTPTDPVINEMVLNHIGSDSHELVEVLGDPATDYSAFTVIELEGDGSGAGVIDGVLPIGTTDSAGFWFSGYLNNELENGTVTLLLVEEFTGAAGDDLDTDNDGLLDLTPWTRIADSVSVTDGGSTDRSYAPAVLTPGFDGVSYTPGGASRIPDGTDTDTATDWVRNDYHGEGLPGFSGTPEPGEAINTPGLPNQLYVVVAEVVINEIDYDQSGTDSAEFVELLNVGGATINLAGLELELINGTGGGATPYRTITLPAVDLAPGGYFVICGDSDQVYSCDLDVSPDSNLIQNGAPDAVALWQGDTLVDTVSYEGNTAPPYTEGSGSGLQDYAGTSFAGISRFPDGADTGQNNVDLSLRCITPGAANTADSSGCSEPGPPALVINEIDYDQPGSDAAEFIELANVGAAAINLGSLALELVNGSGGGATVYKTITLPAVDLAPGEYFVVCGNATTVAECDLDVSPDSNLIQNGAPDAVALWQGGQLIDAVSYEGDTAAPYYEGSGAGLADSGSTGNDFMGISRLPDGFDSNQNNLDLAAACITPGAANTTVTWGCTATGPVLEIFEIQGSDAASPVAGSPVRSLGNVVTGVTAGGFFMQTPVDRADGDPLTSDGIFVYTSTAPAVSVGDLVDVAGTVVEYYELTEIGSSPVVSVVATGQLLPAPQMLDPSMPSGLPADPPELERFEGMLVQLSGITSGPSDRFGDAAVVARSERSLREPGIEYPGVAGLPMWDGNPEVFEINPDGLAGQPDLLLFSGQELFAEGVLSFSYGDYQLLPSNITLGPAPEVLRPVRERATGELTVASQNLLRLLGDDTDLTARLSKLSWQIREVLRAPDILALQEVDTVTTLDALAAQIGNDDPTLGYTAYLLEGNDPGGIDVGFLVRDTVVVSSLSQLGLSETFDFDGHTYTTFDRPPLLLTAEYVGPAGVDTGEPFPISVLVNHLRSLSNIGDAEKGPFVRAKRFEQALRLSEYIQIMQSSDPELRLVVTGDFNAHQFSDGYVDVLGQVTGILDPLGAMLPGTDVVNPDLSNQIFFLPLAERYSYVQVGNGEALDHMLTSAAINPWVTDCQIARGNADAPAALLLDGSTPMRVSDHDAVVVYLLNDADLDGVANDLDRCAGTTIPELVPTVSLGVNRWALVDDDHIFDTQLPPGQSLEQPYTIFDTAGCSCEQIINELHLGHGHVKYGCSDGIMKRWISAVQKE